jgi:stage II sporulation protein AA (anti-sigma F factor antagonist)
MAVTLSAQSDTLTAFIEGDLDHHSAAGIRADIDHAVRISEISRLILDFSRVSFMDSSGIGLVMGRYKLMSERGGVCVVANPPTYIWKVMHISGIDRLCEIITVSENRSPGLGGVKL